MSGLELIGLVGAGVTARSAYVQGKIAEQQSQAEAALLRQKEKEAVAAAQRQALDVERKTKLIASRALALSAAGGTAGSISDEDTIADIYGEGAYRKSLAIYEGTATAYNLEEQAKAREYEGYKAKQAARGKMLSSALSAFGYGKKGYETIDRKYGSAFDKLFADE